MTVRCKGLEARAWSVRATVLLALTSSLVTPGCLDDLPPRSVLSPVGEGVAFAVETPSPDGYQVVGTVLGVGVAADLVEAEIAARNDLRNQAALLGAQLVTIDDTIGVGVPLRNLTKVKLTGRAYKAID